MFIILLDEPTLHFGVCRVGVLMQRVKELNEIMEFLKPR